MENNWQTSDVEPQPTGPSFFDEPVVVKPKKCPFSIFLLAMFQISRGVFVAGVMLLLLLAPSTDMTSGIGVKVVTFILARQNLTSPIVMITLPLAAAYFCVSGYALLRLKKWARNVMMLTSGATVFMWARRFYFDYVFGRTTLSTALQQQSIYAVMAVDAIIFFCLAAYSDTFSESR